VIFQVVNIYSVTLSYAGSVLLTVSVSSGFESRAVYQLSDCLMWLFKEGHDRIFT
jgi:hypothetical protein